MEKQWILPKAPDPGIVATLASGTGACLKAAELLALRGLTDVEEAKRYLDPKMEHLFDPFLIPEMDKAVLRVKEEARRLIDELVAYDPANRTWSASSLHFRLLEALLARQQGDLTAAARLVGEVRPELEGLSAAEPSDRSFILRLAMAWRLEARLRISAGRPDAATAATRAADLGEKLIRKGRATDEDAGECALACVVSGEIAAQAGEDAAARRYWQRAAGVLAPRLTGTRNWQLLDPAARAAAWMGRSAEAHAMIAQLNLLGYVPLDPWPDADRPGAARSSIPPEQPK